MVVCPFFENPKENLKDEGGGQETEHAIYNRSSSFQRLVHQTDTIPVKKPVIRARFNAIGVTVAHLPKKEDYWVHKLSDDQGLR